MLGGQIQEPARRDVINPQEVGAQFADLKEITRRLFGRGKEFLTRTRRERPIGNAFDVKFSLTQAKEAALDRDTGKRSASHVHEVGLERPPRFS